MIKFLEHQKFRSHELVGEICSFSVTPHHLMVRGWPYDGNNVHFANLPTSLNDIHAKIRTIISFHDAHLTDGHCGCTC